MSVIVRQRTDSIPEDSVGPQSSLTGVRKLQLGKGGNLSGKTCWESLNNFFFFKFADDEVEKSFVAFMCGPSAWLFTLLMLFVSAIYHTVLVFYDSSEGVLTIPHMGYRNALYATIAILHFLVSGGAFSAKRFFQLVPPPQATEKLRIFLIYTLMLHVTTQEFGTKGGWRESYCFDGPNGMGYFWKLVGGWCGAEFWIGARYVIAICGFFFAPVRFRYIWPAVPFVILSLVIVRVSYGITPFRTIDIMTIILYLVILAALRFFTFTIRSNFVSHYHLARQLTAISTARTKVLAILVNLLPPSVLKKMLSGDSTTDFDTATVIFSDIAGFTAWCSGQSPAQVVLLLNRMYSDWDAFLDELSVTKVKTIGDAYWAICGLLDPPAHPAANACIFALRMQESTKLLRGEKAHESWANVEIRVGLHTGPVCGTVIGARSSRGGTYELFGEANDIAMAVEAATPIGAVAITSATALVLDEGVANLQEYDATLEDHPEITLFLLESMDFDPVARERDLMMLGSVGSTTGQRLQTAMQLFAQMSTAGGNEADSLAAEQPRKIKLFGGSASPGSPSLSQPRLTPLQQPQSAFGAPREGGTSSSLSNSPQSPTMPKPILHRPDAPPLTITDEEEQGTRQGSSPSLLEGGKTASMLSASSGGISRSRSAKHSSAGPSVTSGLGSGNNDRPSQVSMGSLLMLDSSAAFLAPPQTDSRMSSISQNDNESVLSGSSRHSQHMGLGSPPAQASDSTGSAGAEIRRMNWSHLRLSNQPPRSPLPSSAEISGESPSATDSPSNSSPKSLQSSLSGSIVERALRVPGMRVTAAAPHLTSAPEAQPTEDVQNAMASNSAFFTPNTMTLQEHYDQLKKTKPYSVRFADAEQEKEYQQTAKDWYRSHGVIPKYCMAVLVLMVVLEAAIEERGESWWVYFGLVSTAVGYWALGMWLSLDPFIGRLLFYALYITLMVFVSLMKPTAVSMLPDGVAMSTLAVMHMQGATGLYLPVVVGLDAVVVFGTFTICFSIVSGRSLGWAISSYSTDIGVGIVIWTFSYIIMERALRRRFIDSKMVERATKDVKHERSQLQTLMLHMVPRFIAPKLVEWVVEPERPLLARNIDMAGVMFLRIDEIQDFQSTTQVDALSSGVEMLLNDTADLGSALAEHMDRVKRYVRLVDKTIRRHDEDCTKIKLVGDVILIVSGLEAAEKASDRTSQQAPGGPRWARNPMRFSIVEKPASESDEEGLDIAGSTAPHTPLTSIVQLAIQLDTVIMSTFSVKPHIGLHCGPLIAGIVGTDRLVYDTFGDTVNVASRVMSLTPSGIHASEGLWQACQSHPRLQGLSASSAMTVQAKGKGALSVVEVKTAAQKWAMRDNNAMMHSNEENVPLTFDFL